MGLFLFLATPETEAATPSYFEKPGSVSGPRFPEIRKKPDPPETQCELSLNTRIDLNIIEFSL